MNVLFFGTYDESRHPRVKAVRQGFETTGWHVRVLNCPLGDTTERRVAAARGPLEALMWTRRLLGRWKALREGARNLASNPDVVVIGYLGVFDIFLASYLFRESLLVLDHMAPLAETVRDRRLGRLAQVVASLVDRVAVLRADIVMVDTEEHVDSVQPGLNKATLVPLAAPVEWFGSPSPHRDGPLRVVFFGTHAPLQGTPVIGAAISLLKDDPVTFTMIGTGQDYAECRRLSRDSDRVEWIDWIRAEDLPEVVTAHDVCLGVFGLQTKTQAVVPNKVVQGVAAARVVVTAASPPVSRRLGDVVLFVPPGDPVSLVVTLRALAGSRARVEELQHTAARVARDRLGPSGAIQDVVGRIAQRSTR